MEAFTVKEVCKMLKLHPDTVRRALRSGELKSGKFNREYRISRHDLNEWYKSKGGVSLYNGDTEKPPDPDNKLDRIAELKDKIDELRPPTDTDAVDDDADQGDE